MFRLFKTRKMVSCGIRSYLCGLHLQQIWRPTRCNRGFYCRSYCLLNMFRSPLCPSSGAQEYYTVVAACGISCCGFQVVGLMVMCPVFRMLKHPANRTHNHQTNNLKTTARNTTGSNHCIILLSSWWWAWCPKHVAQAVRSAIKTSVASSWYVWGFHMN